MTVKAKEIPTPIVAEVAGYEADVEPNFKQPQLYIRAKKTGMLQQQGMGQAVGGKEGEGGNGPVKGCV